MTTQNWNDFNDAEQQQGFDLIPKGTLVPVRRPSNLRTLPGMTN